MEKESFIIKIKSKYIIQYIFSFIADKNFLLKLIVYSKLSKKKMNIQLEDYQIIFMSNIIKWKDYLIYEEYGDNFNKNKLKEKLINDISKQNIKYDENIMIKSFIYYIKNNPKKINKKNKNSRRNKDYGYIDFFSPFFDSLSKSKNFNEFFTILISIYEINRYDLLQYYYDKFNELNDLNINYESLRFEYENGYYVDFLKYIPINYKQLKKLELYNNSISDGMFGRENNEEYEESRTNSIVFPLMANATNLIHLSIHYYLFLYKKVNPKTFEFINTFKHLEYLKLDSINFESKFILSLNTLRYLELRHCSNIDITNETYLKLKIFKVNTWEKEEGKNYNENLFNFCQDLEEIQFCLPEFDIKKNINLKQLKKYKGNLNVFCLLESPLLEEVNLKEKIKSIEQFKNIMNKISTFKYLNILHLNLRLESMNDQEISKIKFNNNLITEIYLNFLDDEYDNSCQLFSFFQNKFIKLTNLYIKNKEYLCGNKEKYSKYPLFQIIESPNNNLKNINMKLNKNLGLKIYCQPYDILESLKISFLDYSDNSLNTEFPIFKEKCDKEFKSLKSFKLKLNCHLNFDIFKNINNNLNNMPNLINFSLKVNPKKDELDKFKNIYKIFVDNILSMKYIKRININIFGDDYYSKNELETIFPVCKVNKLSKVKISKMQDISP